MASYAKTGGNGYSYIAFTKEEQISNRKNGSNNKDTEKYLICDVFMRKNKKSWK